MLDVSRFYRKLMKDLDTAKDVLRVRSIKYSHICSMLELAEIYE